MIIGIGHCSRTGKDTLANRLVLECCLRAPDRYIRKQSFAYNLKSTAYALYYWAGMERPEYYDSPDTEHMRYEVLSELGKTPQQIWIDLGMAVRDRVHCDTWWKSMLFHCYTDDVVIVPDVRFLNEVEAIQGRGGILIKVTRPGCEPTTAPDLRLADYDDWDHVVHNASPDRSEINKFAAGLAERLFGRVKVDPLKANIFREIVYYRSVN